MCCFTRPIKLVTDTHIFARVSRAMMQFLVYEMKFKAAEDLAMILPIPVPKKTAEKSVRFISLEKYPNFFTDLESGFPEVPIPGGTGTFGGVFFGRDRSAKLNVVDVGSFEASFVPTIDDFARLDERFRLPSNTWDKFPKYKNYGFAVFKLKKSDRRIHPIAFEFPRVDRSQLFFPTVHIHDGEIHEEAEFDHTLFAQFGIDHQIRNQDWKESNQPAGMFMNITRSAGIISAESHAYKQEIKGTHKNEDILA